MKRKKKKYIEIDPDEIFPDSHNFPGFDKFQLEGRLEKPIKKKTIQIVGIFLILVAFVFTYKIWSLQILKGEAYEIRGKQNNLKQSMVFAERGIILDRNNISLVWNERNKQKDFSKRIYSNKKGLSHLIGYIGYPLTDSKGFYYRDKFIGMNGVEKFMDYIINGENGIKLSEVDVFLRTVSESSIKKPKNGKNIVLTIDSILQEKLFKIIKNVSETFGFSGGAGIIMNVKNGSVIVATSYPEYNSQIMSDGKDKKKIKKFLTDKDNPFLNRVTQGLYSPGSVIKPFLAVGALNEKVIGPNEKIISKGEIKIQNPYNPKLFSTFYDWKAHGPVDIKKAIAVSSNIYFYVIGGGFEGKQGLGISRIEKYVRAFGIAEETGVEWFPESKGVVPNPKWKEDNFGDDEWRVGDTYNTAIGQYGFQVTPIQMVRAISVIANGGFLLKPRIIESDKVEKEKISIRIRKKYFDIVKEGMRDAVLYGTAKGLNIPFVKIAAKTGTAQVGVSKKKVNSWVIGFFPYNNPKYAFAVVMEKGPEKNLMGGLYIMRLFFDWLNINYPEYLK